MSRLILFGLLGISLFIGLSCGDETTIVNSSSQHVNVSGTVYAWRCTVGDEYNNDLNGDLRITSLMDEKAKITFLPKDGVYLSDSTDDSSSYNWSIEAGIYNIILETDFNWPPDTIKDVILNRDTIIDLNVVMDFLVSDTIEVNFTYFYAGDSLGYDSEKKVINRLSQYLWGMLDITNGEIPLQWRNTYISFGESPWESVNYLIPVNGPTYHSGLVAQRANEVLGTCNMYFPTTISVEPAGVYFCLDAKKQK